MTSVLQQALDADDASFRGAVSRLEPVLAQCSLSSEIEERRMGVSLALRASSLEGFELRLELICSVALGLARCNRAFFRRFIENQSRELPRRLLERLESDLSDAPTSIEFLGRIAALTASLVCAPTIAAAFGHSSRLLLRIREIYDELLPALLPPRTTFTLPLGHMNALALQCRLDLLETINEALEQAYMQQRHEEGGRNELADLLIELLDMPSSTSAFSTPRPTSLVNLGLLGDLEALCGLSTRLATFPADEDATSDYIIESLRACVPQDADNGLELLLESVAGAAPTSSDPSKGKAVERSPHTDDSGLEAAIAEVLAVLPDQSPSLVKRCLSHPEFALAPIPVEKVIDALLSGDLPSHLMMATPDPAEAAAPSSSKQRTALADIRANVFEDHIDMSKATRGKQRIDLSLDSAIGQRIDQDLKRSILAFANEDAEQQQAFAREVELDEWDPDMPFAPVRSGEATEGDADEAASEDDNVPDEGDVSAPLPGSGLSPHTSRILERAYLGDAATFAASDAARTGNARRLLRQQTGMANDLIESWAVMLERDPTKDRILARHVTVHEGNERGLAFDQQKVAKGDVRGRGRGNPGRSRGRGSRGGRGQQIQRQRGHDRKVARAGGL